MAEIRGVCSAGVMHSYAVEVRDLGEHGFLLPPTKIEAVGADLLAAALHLSRHISSGRRLANDTDKRSVHAQS